MPQSPIEELLNRLGSPDNQEAWNEFLTEYSPQIYQTVSYLENNSETVADCFQFICEQLIKDRSRRLRKFKGDGAASFATWLRAVVRNLCTDWHRKEFGRPRPFRSLANLSSFDQQVFRLSYERQLSPDECLDQLAADFPNANEMNLKESCARIESVLTPNHRFLLTQRVAQHNSNDVANFDQANDLLSTLVDPRPDPESQAIQSERRKQLGQALSKLEPNARLLLRLRFEEGLTLGEVAKALGLGNAQRAGRQINESLVKLRKWLA